MIETMYRADSVKNNKKAPNLSTCICLFVFLLYSWSMATFLDFFLCQILTECMEVWLNPNREAQSL